MKKDVGSIGIGAMIVFIAMVLVAGIAASVLIQTSTKLESQAMETGQKTIKEVASGLAVYDIEGRVASAKVIQLAICLRARAGSGDIDLNETFVELSDTSVKIILGYTGQADGWNDSGSGVDSIFTATCFPAAANRYGILVMEDADGSVTQFNPTINRGDKVLLCINTTYCFTSASGIAVRTDIFGAVVAEEGSPGIISFTTPASYGSAAVVDLQ